MMYGSILRVVLLCYCIVWSHAQGNSNNNNNNNNNNNVGRVCTSLSDIVFVLDSSESINRGFFAMQLDFVVNVTRQYYFNETHGVVAGLLTFSFVVGDVVHLSPFKTQPEFAAAVVNVRHDRGGTNTHRGIEAMTTMFLLEGRPIVAKVGVLITDGHSRDRQATLNAAETAKSIGIKLFTVAIGKDVDMSEMLEVASGPDYVVEVDDFDGLSGLVLNLSTLVCQDEDEPDEDPFEDCRGNKDVLFAIHDSPSISTAMFQSQLQLAKRVLRRFQLDSTTGVVAGAIGYSNGINIEIGLDQQLTYNAIRREILTLSPATDEGNAVDIAIKRIEDMMAQHGRFNSTKIGVVFVGQEVINPGDVSRIIDAALDARNAGIELIVIGFGAAADMPFLSQVVCCPANLIGLQRLSEFTRADQDITSLICPSEDPCTNCRIINGVGYNSHPGDCTMYIQCYPAKNNEFRSVYRNCGPGLFWDQIHLTCNRPGEVFCTNDGCNTNQRSRIAYSPDSCRTYWECSDRRTVALRCCGVDELAVLDGDSFCVDSLTVPVQDRTCSNFSCVLDEPAQRVHTCEFEEHPTDDSKYFAFSAAGESMEMPCPSGTAFDIRTCSCSRRVAVIDEGCQPILYLPFDEDIQDHAQGNWVDNRGGVEVRNVTGAIGGGAGFFPARQGRSLVIPRFSNYPFGSTLLISFRFLEVNNGVTRTGVEALVTNGDCDIDPTIAISVDRPDNRVNGEATTYATPNGHVEVNGIGTGWKSVHYRYDGSDLLTQVDMAGDSAPVTADIVQVHAALHVGYGNGYQNYYGYIDELYVYACFP